MLSGVVTPCRLLCRYQLFGQIRRLHFHFSPEDKDSMVSQISGTTCGSTWRNNSEEQQGQRIKFDYLTSKFHRIIYVLLNLTNTNINNVKITPDGIFCAC
jgi:hypothetical protein